MSKWQLLRSALQGKRESQSPASIHRNDGIFAVISKAEENDWKWAPLHIQVCAPECTPPGCEGCGKSGREEGATHCSFESVKNACRRYITQRDMCPSDLRVKISAVGSDVAAMNSLRQIVTEGVESGFCLLKSRSHEELLYDSCVSDGNENEDVGVYCWLLEWREPQGEEGSVLRPFMTEGKFFRWILPSRHVLHVREKAREARVSLAQLFSHKLHGVDNTGNVKVWAAESMLLHVILTNYRSDFENRRVLELGGGLTALCGIGIAAEIPGCTVVVTDGHPECVQNQNVCILMNNQAREEMSSSSDSDNNNNNNNNNNSRGGVELPVVSRQLRWSREDPQQDLAAVLELVQRSGPGVERGGGDREKFDRIVAADCLFFRDFHDDLVWLLRAALAPEGCVFLLQPSRGGTMDEFIAKAEAVFSVAILNDYDDQVSALHQRYVQESQGDPRSYDPDIHYPVLLLLKHKVGIDFFPRKTEK